MIIDVKCMHEIKMNSNKTKDFMMQLLLEMSLTVNKSHMVASAMNEPLATAPNSNPVLPFLSPAIRHVT